MSKTSVNFFQEVPNSFLIFVTRNDSNCLNDRLGRCVLHIMETGSFRNLQEGVEIEMLFRPISECEALRSGEANNE